MPAEKPLKTGVPNLVDIDLANSLDLHIASNNFVSIIDDFSEYIALNYSWKIAEQAPDPITAQAELLKKINNNEYKLTASESGVSVDSTKNVTYDLIDLNTYLEDNEIWVRGSNKLPEQFIDSSSDIGTEPRVFFKAYNLATDEDRIVEYIPPLAVKYQTINEFLLKGEKWQKDDNGFPKTVKKGGTKYYIAEIEETGGTRQVRIPSVTYTTLEASINDRITALNDKYSTGFGAGKMSDEFLLYWYEKYKNAHHLVKEEYKKLIGSDYTVNYFEEFSDSISSLGRLFEYPDTTSVMPFDITFTLGRRDGGTTIPRTMPPSIFDKLDSDIKLLVLDSSLTVNRLFKKNAVHAVEEIATAKHSHGTNLMSDYLHYNRMSLQYGDIASIVSDTLGVSYQIMAYTTSAENKQNVASPKLTQIVENHKMQVDILQNKLSTLTKVISGEAILRAGSSDLGSQG